MTSAAAAAATGAGIGGLDVAPAPSFNGTVDLIKSEHVAAARASVRDPEILHALEEEIERDCESLRSFLLAAQVIDEISPRSKDSIVGYGERLGCKIIAAVLRDRVRVSYFHIQNNTLLCRWGGIRADMLPSATCLITVDGLFFVFCPALAGHRCRVRLAGEHRSWP